MKQRKTFERTIDEALFETIKVLRRVQDAGEITEMTGLSRPTIDKALNFGHIRDLALEKAIIEYYSKRAADQKSAAIEILKSLTN